MIANLTCPFCSRKQGVAIPKDRCLFMHRCEKCGKLIKARDCCVICEFSNRKCPVSIK